MNAPLIGARIARKEDYRFLTGAGQYTDDVTLPNQAHAVFVRSPHAHAKIKAIKLDKALKAPGVLDSLHRRGPRRRESRRPALRLADHRRQRPADEGAAAPLPRAGQGAPRRRPGRGGGRRDADAGEGRGGAGRGRLRGAAGGGRRVKAAQEARSMHDGAPDNTCYVWALGDKAAVRRGVRQGGARHQARVRQQPADPERDRAARRDRRATAAPTTPTRSTSRTRTRTSSGC